jgi:hypothetical protein
MNGGDHFPMPPSSAMESALPHTNNEGLVATAAVDLIRQLDAAFADMSSYVVAGARDAEEARKNARVASELARRFSSKKSLAYLNDPWTEEIPVLAKPQQAPPPPPAAAYSAYQNGTPFSSPHLTTVVTEPPSSSARSKRLHKTAERLAVAHAEDLLHVTLELERTKHSLENEQMSHDETKAAWQRAKQKNGQLEAQIEKLLQDMETAREESGRKIDQLEHDMQRAEHRIETAEYEAAMATDICIQADEQKEETERLLQRALAEINLLKEHIAASHSAEDLQSYLYDPAPGHGVEEEKFDAQQHRQRRVRFHDDVVAAAPPRDDSSAPPPHHADRPSRALVAAGRQLLHRTFSSHDGGAAMVSRHSTEASAARRQRLRHRLQTLGMDDDLGDDDFDKVDDSGHGHRRRRRSDYLSNSSAVEALDICRNAAQILKESGRRLNLTGRWFHDGPTTTSTVTDEIHLETLAKHYTTLVEVRTHTHK